jgi:hypothetical protein
MSDRIQTLGEVTGENRGGVGRDSKSGEIGGRE